MQLVATSLDCPSAVVSLLDEEFQWFKARINLDTERTERKDAFCNHTIQSDGIFPLTHTQCVAPVISAVNFFFDSYSQLMSSNSNIVLDRNIKLHYYADQMYTEIPREYEGDDFIMKVFSIEGREVLSKRIDKGIAVHELNLPMSGMYVTTILNNKGIIANQKFVKP